MKKTAGSFLIILTLSFCFSSAWSQKKTSLEGRWLQMDSLINTAGQPRTAFRLLDTITTIARREHQKDALIRASVYRLSLQQTIEDAAPEGYLLFVDSLISAADGPVEGSLLRVLKAKLLSSLYARDRRKIMSRTDIKGEQPGDSRIAYWTTADFQRAIGEAYTKALVPSALLQQTPNRKYRALIHKGNTPLLRPTVYDLILHEAIAYYSSPSAADSPSEQSYVPDNSRLLAPAADFATFTFTPPDASDSLNSHWKLLGYYQDLIAFHLKDDNPAALADIDLERLNWAYELLTQQAPDKYKETYRSALRKAISAYSTTRAALYGAFQLADTYADDAGHYRAGEDTAHRYDYVHALKIINRFQPALDQAIETAAATKNKDRVSHGAAGLLNLKSRILAPYIKLETESVNTPDEPMRALLSFRNVSKLYFKVLRLPVSMENLHLTDSLWRVMAARTPLKTFSQVLPVTGDHQQHSAEIRIPALGKGSYLLLVSANRAFRPDRTLAAVNFSVSNLAYVRQGADMFFVDRKTGKPLNGVDVRLYDRTWKKDRYQYILRRNMHSGADGRVTLRKDNNGSFSLMAIYQQDSLSSAVSYYQPYRYHSGDENGKGEKNITFYLDRGIYRPGQELLFKGIATIMYQDVRGRKLLRDDKKHTVYLYDANNQKTDSLLLTLNDFGSLSGKFNLPEGRLSGRYSLSVAGFEGRKYFQVEQYKRPTYFVGFDTLKTAVAVGDSVTVTGQAMAYSGYPVTDARIEIVVTRNVYFPYSWYRYIPQVAATPVAHGTVLTDDQGKFSFTFKAAGGKKSWNRLMPNYHYTVAATSTDLTGETREARTSVAVGSQPFNLAVSVPENTRGDLLDTLNLVSTTANGQFTPQRVTLRITKLAAPERLLRKRRWGAPDMAVIDSLAFIRDFPHDPYLNEADKDFWKREAVVYEQLVTTRKSGKIGLNKDIKPGWYEIVCEAPGVDGQTIKDRQYVYLYDPKAPLAAPDYNWSDPGKTKLLPGEQSGIMLASSARDQYVIYSTTRKPGQQQALTYGHTIIQDKPALLPVQLSAEEIHGAILNYVYVRAGRQYTGSLTVHLKDTATQPEIVYESFRDKTEPGSKEHWTLHINKGGERLKDMELLSSMYDASLDQFVPHNWTLLNKYSQGGLYPAYWNNGEIFGVSGSEVNHISNTSYTSVKTYDRFIYDQYLRQLGIGRALMGRIPGLVVSNDFSGQAGKIMVRGTNEATAMAYRQSAKKDLVPGVEIVVEGSTTQPALQPARSDFRETAFFFPHVHSDDDGNYTIGFQMPDALTSWKWMNLAYDKELHMVKSEKKVISQKTLMVVPNLPRFVRNGDHWTLSAKVVNLSGEPLNSNVSVVIEDPVTGQVLHWLTGQPTGDQVVPVAANSNATVRFDIVQPADFTGPVYITVQAKGGQYSDAEKNILPVLTGKMLVTETLPIYLKGDGEKTFTMDKLISLKDSEKENKESKKLVLELTTNPVWHVVMALPDIQIGEKPNAAELLNKLYADAMGAYVMRSYPAIAKVIRQWSIDTAAENKDVLLSALEKNPDLKSVLLEQTPWVVEASDETAQHRALVRFFNKQALDSSQRSLASRLLSLQEDNGGFSWFSGGRADITSTQNILTGIYQLMAGRLKDPSLAVPLSKIAADANQYLSRYYTMKYEQWLLRQKQEADRKGNDGKKDIIYPVGASEIQYLYALSLNSDLASPDPMQQFLLRQERYNWQGRSVYLQLMIAATQYKMGDKTFAIDTVIASLLDRTVRSETLGTYWKKDSRYYNWYDNPMQAQALAIGLLSEIGKETAHVHWKSYIDEMLRYLIGQKQVNHWPAARTTIDACVAIIDAAAEHFSARKSVDVKLGRQRLDLDKQAGTGYMRYEVAPEDIVPSMGQVTVEVKGMGANTTVPVYGALYWQYISPMADVEAAANTPGISLQKGLYREIHTNNGTQLVAVKATDRLQVGDKLISRFTIRLDRDMDYVHLREMRAAGLQPDQTISGYQFRDGLAYYQTIGDLSTDLFFDHIAKGSYVIEYPVHVSHSGRFEAGTAMMESFYAPEFATHTEGIRIQAVQ